MIESLFKINNDKESKSTCNLASSSTNSRGNKSDLVDDNCPSLIKVGPSCNTRSLSHEAVVLLLFFCRRLRKAIRTKSKTKDTVQKKQKRWRLWILAK